MSMRRILVLRGGAVGDFALTIPALQALRAQRPDAHIALLCYPRVAGLARAAGLADETVSLERADVARMVAGAALASPEWRSFVSSFDLALSWLHDPDGVVREALLRAGIGRVASGSPLVASGHAADALTAPLAELGIPFELPVVPRLRLPGELVARAAKRLETLGPAPVLIHPGSGSPKKNWPAESFHALAGRLEKEAFTPVFLFGEADDAARETIKALRPGVVALEGLDLIELAALLAAGRAFVGNDSGVTHLAAAAGAPAVALFGPTDPAMWGPRGDRVRILRSPDPGNLAAIQPHQVMAEILIRIRGTSSRE